MKYATIEERKEMIMQGGELSLAVENTDTNLRIWRGKEGSVCIRLDKFEAYSAPLSQSSYDYLEQNNEVVKALIPIGFLSPVENLDSILEITKDLKSRLTKKW